MSLERLNSAELIDDSDLGKTVSSSYFNLTNNAAYSSAMSSVQYQNVQGLNIETYDNHNVVKFAAPPRSMGHYGWFYLYSNWLSAVQNQPEIEWDAKLMNYESINDYLTTYSSVYSTPIDCSDLIGCLCGKTSYNDRNGDFRAVLLPVKGKLTPCVISDSPRNGYVPLPAKVLNGDWVHFRYYLEYENGVATNICIEVDHKDVLKQSSGYTYIDSFYIFQTVFCGNSSYLSKFSVPYFLISNIVRSSLIEV